jgi:tRNA-modifying protein YgfZ
MFSHAEYAALHEGAGFLDRSGRGRIRLTGADRREYLHGQLTNDIAALSPGEGCYAALLTPQGRMISDMRVSELGDEVLIDLPAETAGAVRARLDELIFSEDVRVDDSRALAQIGLYGPGSADVLAAILRPASAAGGTDAGAPAGDLRERLGRIPLNANAGWTFDGLRVVTIGSDDYGVRGFELLLESAPAQARDGAAPERGPAGATVDDFMGALRRHGAQPISLETANVCRVEAGRPAFGADMDEHTIPLEAGIEDRAISMTKGCYVGQEVIIRVLHRGHGRVARRLVGFAADADGVRFAPGDRLLAGDGAGKDIGVITSAVISPRLGRPIALGYVHRDFAEPGTVIRAAAGAGAAPDRLVVVPVPFTA